MKCEVCGHEMTAGYPRSLKFGYDMKNTTWTKIEITCQACTWFQCMYGIRAGPRDPDNTYVESVTEDDEDEHDDAPPPPFTGPSMYG